MAFGNITTLNNQFHFNLPIDFVPDIYEERYMKLLGNQRKLYKTVVDYLNSTIQDISFPGINFPTVSNPQVTKRKKIKWKTVGNIYDLFEDTITVTLLNVDGNVNYLIFLDILMKHYLNTDKSYDEPIMITVIDQNRNALYHIQFKDVIWTGLSSNKFAFNDQTIQNKNFTMTFEYNFIDFQYVADNVDIITDNTYGSQLNNSN